MDTKTKSVDFILKDKTLREKMDHWQSEEGKAQIKIWKEKHETILRKYKIRAGDNLDVITEEEEEGKKKQRAITETYLIDFTYPADFKTTFEYIDKYMPDLIKKAESMNIQYGMTTGNKITIKNNLKHWWFGLLQGRMEEDNSFKNL